MPHLKMPSCSKQGEGWGPVSQKRDFDFTLCFEEGVILPALFSALIVIGLARSLLLAREVGLHRSQKSRKVLYSKLVLLVLASILTVGSLTTSLVFTNKVRWPLPTTILSVVAYLSTPLLTYFNHTRTPCSSSILLLFWPNYIFAFLVWLRSILAAHLLSKSDVTVWLQGAAAVLGFAAFWLEFAGVAFKSEDDYEEIGTVGENPFLTANIYSRWSFAWMTPLMKLGRKKYLTEEDMYALLPQDEAERLGDRLGQAMKRHTSLWIALFVAYGGPFVFALCMKFVQDSLNFLQPQLLRLLLSYISRYQEARQNDPKGPRPSPYEGFAIAFLMFCTAMTQTTLLHQYFQRVYETGMRVRAGLVTSIYRKALVLSGDERAARASGDIVNIMSVDTVKLQDLCTYGLVVFSGPYQITLAFVSLYNLLGWPAFVGVAIMALSLPLNTTVARYLKRLQQQQMKNRDQRTRLMTELLNNIKSIKLYGWEPAFTQRILKVRNDQELRLLRKLGITIACNNTLWQLIPILVAFSSFAVAAMVSEKPLTADIIFPALSMFMLLQFPMAMFANITTSLIEAMVSVRRLSSFLRASELQSDARKVIHKSNLQEGDETLVIREGEFEWSKDQTESTLHGIDLTVRKGELVGVLGRVGAGKSSLLSAIIGEMHRVEGEVVVSGSIAYCPQTPWIMSASVRDNILFSHAYDPEFYEMVLDACALRQDLGLLSDGDLTQVGEKGIYFIMEFSQLSGGQRARISLARAVYARADLSVNFDNQIAVDSHVARHVFGMIFSKSYNVIGPIGILSSKARILVTNTISFLKQHDQLIYLRRGIILESGCYQDVISDPSRELHKLLTGHGRAFESGSSTPRDDETLISSPSESVDVDSSSSDASAVQKSLEKVSGKLDGKQTWGRATLAAVNKQGKKEGAQAEHTERGRVKWSVYLAYMKAASRPGFVLFVLTTFTTQAAQLLSNVTLKQWGDHNQQDKSNSDKWFYLTIYGSFNILQIMSAMTGFLTIFILLGLRSARHLHNAMLFAVMRAPLSFFEQTPTGRILNLFSRDTYVIDQVLTHVIAMAFRNGSAIIAILIVVATSFPPFLFFIPILGYFYYKIMVYYLSTGRELKRLDATSKSPIFTSFSEMLNGISTIRAFSQQNIFITNNQHRIDRNQMCYLPAISVNRWLAVRLETLGSSLIFIGANLACIALVTTRVNAGLVGLVISYGMNTTSSLNWFVRTTSEVEQNVVSVERILHQTEVKPEAPEHIPDMLPDGWPSKGKVEFKDYSMRYRPGLDLVLKDINLSIRPREKIGICGRTGAGKSSLLLALFRIIEPASGTIYIDGVDITTIGLNDLRSVISIIPQEPQLFEGTMRENIDPIGVAEDSAIWKALEQSKLKDYVQSLPGGLDAKVHEGGSSLSSGQRQLLCFARALLRNSKVLVLDEATSAIDLDTDKAVQEILRGPQFANTTILTIAHRLNTIIGSDRVLVLSDGKVAEFDTPKALIENPDSIFASLAREAGVGLPA
ncbi:hypothetical protein M422DRAFT_199806 [Sphaerobolus stellatus SS14]|nr:hypothetical protein M422DRAFT_199806 [Sphaerobolus stellatus SS14]